MSFTSKPSISLSLDQVMDLVDQLSTADKLKVAKRMKRTGPDAEIDELIAIFSKVKMTEKDVTRVVEEERARIHARKKAHPARR